MKAANIVAFIILIAGISAAMIIFVKKTSDNSLPESVLEPFARCLASKNITMYGAEWCSHCKKEKALFGEAFRYVPYVECPLNEKLCLEKGIGGYPTWIDGKGNKYEGEQGLEKLSKISGCPLAAF